MIDRQGGFFYLTCDVCQQEAGEAFFEFDEAVQYKKGYGWKSCDGNPACMAYCRRVMRSGLPLNDEVVYGKVGCFGYLVHFGRCFAWRPR